MSSTENASTNDLADLAESLLITEDRQRTIDLGRKRLTVDHSLVLHRDSASVTDIEAMIAHLRRSGMPDTATLAVDVSTNHTRMWARWSAETPADVTR